MLLSCRKKTRLCPFWTDLHLNFSVALRATTFIGIFFLVYINTTINITTFKQDPNVFFFFIQEILINFSKTAFVQLLFYKIIKLISSLWPTQTRQNLHFGLNKYFVRNAHGFSYSPNLFCFIVRKLTIGTTYCQHTISNFNLLIVGH